MNVAACEGGDFDPQPQGALRMDDRALRERLTQAGLSPATVQKLLSRAAPSARIVPIDERPGTRASGSCLGGTFHTTSALEWPTYKGKRLPYIACIRLADLPAEVLASGPFPHRGSLLFFSDGEGDIRGFRRETEWPWRILFVEQMTEGCRHLPAENSPRCHPVTFEEEVTVPHHSCPVYNKVRHQHGADRKIQRVHHQKDSRGDPPGQRLVGPLAARRLRWSLLLLR